MTSEHLQNVSSSLEKLHGHAYFRVDDGPLKECLLGHILESTEVDPAEELSEASFDFEVNIGQQEGEGEPVLGYSADRAGFVHRSEIQLMCLTESALADLEGYLERLVQQAPAGENQEGGERIIRKKQEHDHHEQDSAAARLKVSPQWLKSVVPCTEYSYDEIDGKKYIREYYWSRELIERLFKIKSSKTTPEDLQYVAKECCDGDVDWARDLIARLKSPNRPEPAANKDQAQRNQKGAAQPKVAAPGTAQTKVAAPGAAQTKVAAPGERVRSRSRHKRQSRQGAQAGKDPQRKPDPSPGPKAP